MTKDPKDKHRQLENLEKELDQLRADYIQMGERLRELNRAVIDYRRGV